MRALGIWKVFVIALCLLVCFGTLVANASPVYDLPEEWRVLPDGSIVSPTGITYSSIMDADCQWNLSMYDGGHAVETYLNSLSASDEAIPQLGDSSVPIGLLLGLMLTSLGALLIADWKRRSLRR